jgi:hypothetical protein
MLKAERASKPGPSQTPPNGTTAAAGPTSPSPSINHHNDDGGGSDDELESSVNVEGDRGQGCCTCCHSNTRRRGRRRGREGNEAAITESTEMRRCGSEAQDKDLDESVFTGQFHCVYVVYAMCVVIPIILLSKNSY